MHDQNKVTGVIPGFHQSWAQESTRGTINSCWIISLKLTKLRDKLNVQYYCLGIFSFNQFLFSAFKNTSVLSVFWFVIDQNVFHIENGLPKQVLLQLVDTVFTCWHTLTQINLDPFISLHSWEQYESGLILGYSSTMLTWETADLRHISSFILHLKVFTGMAITLVVVLPSST